MKERRYCEHKDKRLRHQSSMRSLCLQNKNNSKNQILMGNQESLVDWQDQNRLKNRRMQRYRQHCGRITNNSSSNNNSSSKKSLGIYSQYEYPIAYTNRDVVNERQSAQQQLKHQLQKQISQLYPIKKSFSNLAQYYQQITFQYNSLLNQMHLLNKLSLPLSNIDRGQQLRQLQIQYEQKSDYLNIHLVPKLTSLKKDNLSYCQQFNMLEIELKQTQQLVKNNLLEKDILYKQQNKLKEQLSYQHINNQQTLTKLQTLKKTINNKQQTLTQYKTTLQILKSKQQHKYQKQTQLLQTINQHKDNNNKLIISIKQLKEKQKLAEQLNQQRKNRVNINSNQFKSTTQKNHQLQKKLIISKRQSIQLQTTLSSKQKILQQKQSLLQSLLTKQIPQQQQQYKQLKQQYIKNSKFLTYLRQYQKQLKQTSQLMFLKLNQCCKEDYQKLIKNKPKTNKNHQQKEFIVVKDQKNNLQVSRQIQKQKQRQRQRQKSKQRQRQEQRQKQKNLQSPKQNQSHAQSQINDLNYKLATFKFNQQSVQKLIQQRLQLQTNLKSSY